MSVPDKRTLVEIMVAYANHEDYCIVRQDDSQACDCGFDEIRTAYEKTDGIKVALSAAAELVQMLSEQSKMDVHMNQATCKCRSCKARRAIYAYEKAIGQDQS